MDRKYTEDLIKGKITEVIFEEMFRQTGKFTIIPLGYEHTTPILAQYQHLVHVQKVLDNIRSAPDFALVSEDKGSVFLVEVKYRETILKEEVIKISEEILKRWDPCYLFVASKDSFYFTPCNKIINSGGEQELLQERWILQKIQDEFKTITKKFIF